MRLNKFKSALAVAALGMSAMSMAQMNADMKVSMARTDMQASYQTMGEKMNVGHMTDMKEAIMSAKMVKMDGGM